MTASAFVPSAGGDAPRVLADAMVSRRAGDVVVVGATVLLTALLAQLVIPVPFSPVPITGQTFAVLLGGTVLGARRGAVAMGAYVVLGAVGLPFFAEAGSGLEVVLGATGGYLLGFVVAGALVGWLAERGMDRTLPLMALLYGIGSGLIYLTGVPWLAVVAEVSLAEAARLGLFPFLVGDAVKALVAAALVPAAWHAVRRVRG